MGISFEQIRTSTNPGLEDDGSGALRVKAGFGVKLGSAGLLLDANDNMFKKAVRAHQSANVTLSGGAPNTVDGVTLSTNDRVLVSGQTTGSEDGIYFVQTVGTGSNGTWVRVADAAVGDEAAGWFIPVLEGTVDANSLYQVQAVQGGATVGTDGWTVALFEGTTAATLAGAGLVANGDALDVNVDNSSLEVAADTVQIKALGVTNAMLAGSIANAKLSNSSVTVTAGVGLKNGGAVALGASTTLNIEPADFAGTGLEDDGFDNLRLTTQGNGIAGGNGSTLSVQADGGTLTVGVGGVKVSAGGVSGTELNASVAGAGLAGGAGSALSVGAGTGITVNANDVQISAGGVTGTELAASVAGAGLAGGAGSALSVGAGTGLQANANDMAINLNSTVNFASSTPVWTFGNETTGEGLFVTGTPVDGNHVPNKTYVDNLVTGLKWLEPVNVLKYQGTRTVAQINALSPVAGWAVVAGDAGTPTAGLSDVLAAGDIAEYDGANWKKIVTNSGGFPPAGTRAVVDGGVLFSPLADGTDEGKIAKWDGTSLTPALVAPADGNALLVNGETSIYENSGFTFDTNQWIQFTGAASIVAGAGMTKNGNTLDVGAGNGISVGADTVAVAADTTSTGATASVVAVGGNGVAVRVDNASIEGSGAGGSLRIKALGIATGMLADLAVTTAKIGSAQVTDAKIAANTITAGSIAANTITATEIAANTITATEIVGNTITAAEIAANTITNAEIAANTVALDRLNIRFREEEIAASSFTNANPSTADLAVAALIGVNADQYNEVYRNGLADMANQGNGGSPASSTQYKIDNSGTGSVGRVTIGANINGTGNSYRVKYLSVT